MATPMDTGAPLPHPTESDLWDDDLFSKVGLAGGSVAFEDPVVLEEPYVIEEFEGVVFLSSRGAKRPWLWAEVESDQESNSSDSEPGPHKRPRTRSLSPISLNTDSRDTSLDSDADNHMELPGVTDDFLRLRQQPEAYVDKTRCLAELAPTFRYLLLRPPRFGKTAFLSTLAEHFDIRGSEEEHFDGLAVAHGPADMGANQHLCLSFTLSEIYSLSNIIDIDGRLMSHVMFALCRFLMKYAEELQIHDPEMFLQPPDPDVSPTTVYLFAKVFAVVRSRGYTLFVGVDDYDAPFQSRSFMHLQYPDIPDDFASPRDIECLFDKCFWGPLRAGSDTISKLVVAGTLSLLASPSSVNLRALDLVAAPVLQTSCGFTEAETLAFAGAFLDAPLDVVNLQRLCGQYIFSPPSTTTEPVFHPQELILHVAELSHKPVMPYTPESFPLLPRIFKLLPEDSTDPGIVTTNGLIDLLASGTVTIDRESPRELNGTAVSWSVFQDLGVLTYDADGAVRVANITMLDLIHDHIDAVFAERHGLDALYSALQAHDVEADSTLLAELLSTILRAQMQRALASSGPVVEPTAHGIFELVIRNKSSANRDPDPAVLMPPRRLPMVDVRTPFHKEAQKWALRTLSLRGMWRGANPNATDEPSVDVLRELHKELMGEDDESLGSKHCVLDTGERVLVGSLLEADPGTQLVLAVGGARVMIRKRGGAD
ncbi:hypothetical protein C8R46DRAFT_1352584 [Mycena filopes]|nr:hypothetical protein C8R46DRAFT_1352584 [Mycena filopes]